MHQNKLDYTNYIQPSKKESKQATPNTRGKRKWLLKFALYGWPKGMFLPFLPGFSLILQLVTPWLYPRLL